MSKFDAIKKGLDPKEQGPEGAIEFQERTIDFIAELQGEPEQRAMVATLMPEDTQIVKDAFEDGRLDKLHVVDALSHPVCMKATANICSELSPREQQQNGWFDGVLERVGAEILLIVKEGEGWPELEEFEAKYLTRDFAKLQRLVDAQVLTAGLAIEAFSEDFTYRRLIKQLEVIELES